MTPAKTQIRHVDKGFLLGTFASESLVVCPKCTGPALVTCKTRFTLPFIPTDRRVCCLKCSFQKVGEELSWCGAVNGLAQERCPNCGFKWLQKTFDSNSFSRRTRKSTPIACPSCQQTSKVEINWHIDSLGKPQDPAFGLPLWLQAPCCGDTLWAYNAKHLKSLRDYVAAGLRERVGVIHWSMFARLPKWISAKKNRDAVLACIDRLEEKLPTSHK
jgi:hypothetical protein